MECILLTLDDIVLLVICDVCALCDVLLDRLRRGQDGARARKLAERDRLDIRSRGEGAESELLRRDWRQMEQLRRGEEERTSMRLMRAGCRPPEKDVQLAELEWTEVVPPSRRHLAQKFR